MKAREHGTHACYVHGPDRRYQGRGCRCEACRVAHAAYERHRRASITPPYVDATEARGHVRALMAAGIGPKTIAAAAGVPHGSIAKLIYGDPQRGMAPSKRIRPATAAKLLAVTVDAAMDGSRVPAGPTWAVIDELRSRGWTKTAIGHAIGQTGPGLQLGRKVVTRRNAHAIAALLEKPVPPRGTRHGPVASTWVRDVTAERRASANRTSWLVANSLPAPTPGPDLTGAACRHRDIPTWLFYAAETDTAAVDKAKRICSGCPVRDACLAWALDHDEQGIWGGTTRSERDQLTEVISA